MSQAMSRGWAIDGLTGGEVNDDTARIGWCDAKAGRGP